MINWPLKQKIVEAYATQMLFAEAVGIPSSILSMIVNGRMNPTEAEKKVIAKKLKTTIEALWPNGGTP